MDALTHLNLCGGLLLPVAVDRAGRHEHLLAGVWSRAEQCWVARPRQVETVGELETLPRKETEPMKPRRDRDDPSPSFLLFFSSFFTTTQNLHIVDAADQVKDIADEP